jgi:outer membrane protein OmpA-like peptidoglycan-associated protein
MSEVPIFKSPSSYFVHAIWMARHLETKEKKMLSRYAFLGGLVIASVISLTSPVAEAHSTSNVLAVRDSRGQAVRSSNGNCVITRWEGNDGVCEGTSTQIALEDRTVYFDFNDSSLTEAARGKLDSLLPILKSNADIQNVSIVGYADRVGSHSYNQALSKKRAMNVKQYLATNGYNNASVTKTRWVGKSKASANCAAKLGHNALVSCLSPDRKVEVEVNYKKTKKVRK